MAVNSAGPVASFSDVPDVTRGPLLMRIIWAMLAVSIIVVALRIYAKISIARKLYVDDWLMIAALACATVHASFLQVAVNNGFGRHVVYVPLATLTEAMKYSTLSLFWGFLSPSLGRISFCFTLIFLARTVAKFKTWPMYLCIALQLGVNSMGIIVFYTQCGTHFDTLWTPEKRLRHREYCRDTQIQAVIGYFLGSFNTVTDGFLAVMPALLVHRSNMSPKRKLGVAVLLCLSSLAMIASISKTWEVKAFIKSTDATYDLARFLCSLVIELNIVIIAASIPFLRPLFHRRTPRRRRRLPPGSHVLPLGRVATSNSHFPLSSGVSSKNHSRTNTVESEQNVSGGDASPAESSSSRSDTWAASEVQGAITVTTEVSVSYEKMDAPELHAALVGLVQGELANPRLART